VLLEECAKQAEAVLLLPAGTSSFLQAAAGRELSQTLLIKVQVHLSALTSSDDTCSSVTSKGKPRILTHVNGRFGAVAERSAASAAPLSAPAAAAAARKTCKSM
jgi:hypothetical protein